MVAKLLCALSNGEPRGTKKSVRISEVQGSWQWFSGYPFPRLRGTEGNTDSCKYIQIRQGRKSASKISVKAEK